MTGNTAPSGASYDLNGGRVRSRDGTQLGYLSVGAGPVLLCLHGALASGSDWLPAARLLAVEYQVVMLDRRGHGCSDTGVLGHDLQREIEDIAAVLDVVGPAKGMLAHSFGAVIGLHAAAQLPPESFGCLLLYEPPLAATGQVAETIDGLVENVADGAYERCVTAASKHMMGMSDAEIEMMRRSPKIWAAMVSMAPSLVVQARILAQVGGRTEGFSKIVQPTLLLLGESSPWDPFGLSAQMVASTLPSSDTVLLTGQTHFALTQAPDLLVNAAQRFMRHLPR
jgi:pimeloyl-ACP methyl ester carboxylesterase